MDDRVESPADGLRFVGVSLDCADPNVLADFYLQLLGGEIAWRSQQSAGVRVRPAAGAAARGRLPAAGVARRSPSCTST